MGAAGLVGPLYSRSRQQQQASSSSTRTCALASSSAAQTLVLGVSSRTSYSLALVHRRDCTHTASSLKRTRVAASRMDQHDTESLGRARGALLEAQRQIELLTQQADGAAQLQRHMLEQDQLVEKLQSELLGSEVQGAEGINGKMQQQGRPTQSPQELQSLLEAKEEELQKERQRVSEAKQQASELEREVQDAAAQAQDATARLSKQQRELAALEAELSRAPGGGPGKAGSSGRGFGAKKGKKGAGNELLQLQLQTASLKQAVEQAKLELEEQRRVLARCEAESTAANDNLERMGASCKDQAVQVATITAELLQLRQQLAELGTLQQQEEQALAARQRAVEAAAAEQAAQAAAKLEELQQQLARSERDRASSQEEAEQRRQDTAQLHLKMQELKEETSSLRTACEAADAQAEALRTSLEESRQHPLELLELQLKEVSVGIETVFTLRSDLQVLADAFQVKEAEAERLRGAVQQAETHEVEVAGKLEEAREREVEVQLELQGVLQQVLQLKDLVSELQYANSKLAAQNQELQTSIRAQDRVTRTVESKTVEMEGSLVGFSENLVMLKNQLQMKTQALEEASQKLVVAQAEEQQACAGAEALAAQVEAQRKSNLLRGGELDMLRKELQFSRNEVEKLRRAQLSLQSTSEAVLQRQADVQVLKERSTAAEGDKQQLLIQLDRSTAEAAARQEDKRVLEDQHNAELSASLQHLEALTSELELLQKQGARSKALDQKQRDLVQAQAQVDQLRAAVAQQQELLVEALGKEDAMQEELGALQQQVGTISSELEASRAEASAWDQEAVLSTQQLAAARAAGAEMQAQLLLEAQRTQELLTQAERLLLATPGVPGIEPEGDAALAAPAVPGSSASGPGPRAAAAQADGASGTGLEAEEQRLADLEEEAAMLKAAIAKLQEQDAEQRATVQLRDVVAAENRAAAVQAESEALRERVQLLESVVQSEGVAELQGLPLHSLAVKVEALQEENQELKQLTRRQERKLKQTRRFLQGQSSQPGQAL